MSNVAGKTVADVVLFLQRELEARGQPVQSGPAVVRYLNEAVRDLARDAGAFRRVELFPAVQDKAEYTLAQTQEKVLRVRFEGALLAYKSQDELDANPDTTDWRTASGDPERWTGKGRVRLTPIPSSAGAALTFATATKLTAEAGYTITGHGYSLAFNAGSEIFFLPGDGTISNEETAAGRILVEYSYTPDEMVTTTVIPSRFIRALQEYSFYRMIPGADGEKHLAIYQAEKNTFAAGLVDPAWEFRHYEAAQQALAAGQPMPRLMAEDYERIVQRAFAAGDPTGRNYVLGRDFLQGAIQAAIAEGKAVPAEIRSAYDQYIHDFEPYAAELAAALPWQYCVEEVRRAIINGTPISTVVMAAYLSQRKVQMAGPTRRSLEGESACVRGGNAANTYGWGSS